MSSKILRSPLFYVGDKYKLMPQLLELFPPNIRIFYDVFCGGGSVSLNTPAEKYVLNDINDKVMDIHSLLRKNSTNMESFILNAKNKSKKYGLSISEDFLDKEIIELKKEFKKTYFSVYNKEAYLQLRDDYNKNQNSTMKLYLLLVYGFNHMIRFNQSGKFNLPVGNVDWNKNVSRSLRQYGDWVSENDVQFHSMDFLDFVNSNSYDSKDFLYFDPPYLITFSEYNKLWSEYEEKKLYKLLDILNERGINWGLSNMLVHKGQTNDLLYEWSKKYNIYQIESNYISRFDNSLKRGSKEIYVTNFIKK